MEVEFPIEIVVEGVPPSLQASARFRKRWRNAFRQIARPLLPETYFTSTKPTHVTIYYFPDTEMQGDLDNIIKGILDSIKGFIIATDRQVERLLVEKFEPARLVAFENPTDRLASAIEVEGPRVYIRIDARGEEAFQ